MILLEALQDAWSFEQVSVPELIPRGGIDQDRESGGEDGNLQTLYLAISDGQVKEHSEPRVEYHSLQGREKNTGTLTQPAKMGCALYLAMSWGKDKGYAQDHTHGGMAWHLSCFGSQSVL